MQNTGAASHPDTLPKLVLEKYRKHPSRVAMRKKDFGIWNPYTWEDCYINVKYFALGLKEMGFQPGDKVSIRISIASIVLLNGSFASPVRDMNAYYPANLYILISNLTYLQKFTM